MYLILFLIIYIACDIASSENIGWKSYLAENPTEFHDLPLQWVLKNKTSVPNWLTGVFVRNGAAQVSIFEDKTQ